MTDKWINIVLYDPYFELFLYNDPYGFLSLTLKGNSNLDLTQDKQQKHFYFKNYL